MGTTAHAPSRGRRCIPYGKQGCHPVRLYVPWPTNPTGRSSRRPMNFSRGGSDAAAESAMRTRLFALLLRLFEIGSGDVPVIGGGTGEPSSPRRAKISAKRWRSSRKAGTPNLRRELAGSRRSRSSLEAAASVRVSRNRRVSDYDSPARLNRTFGAGKGCGPLYRRRLRAELHETAPEEEGSRVVGPADEDELRTGGCVHDSRRVIAMWRG